MTQHRSRRWPSARQGLRLLSESLLGRKETVTQSVVPDPTPGSTPDPNLWAEAAFLIGEAPAIRNYAGMRVWMLLHEALMRPSALGVLRDRDGSARLTEGIGNIGGIREGVIGHIDYDDHHRLTLTVAVGDLGDGQENDVEIRGPVRIIARAITPNEEETGIAHTEEVCLAITVRILGSREGKRRFDNIVIVDPEIEIIDGGQSETRTLAEGDRALMIVKTALLEIEAKHACAVGLRAMRAAEGPQTLCPVGLDEMSANSWVSDDPLGDLDGIGAEERVERDQRCSEKPRHADGIRTLALYDVEDIERVLWAEDEEDDDTPRGDLRQIAILSRLRKKGAAAALRDLRQATPETVRALRTLGARAPHFAPLTDLLVEHAQCSLNTGTPLRLPPVLIVDEPGTGKTWYLSRLAAALGIPFADTSLAAVSLGEGMQGTHPSWRSADQGLVSKLLLSETTANPLIFVDEFDKPPGTYNWGGSPYRPYYGLLDPANAHRFVDEFLGIPMDASRILWVLAANGTGGIPDAILSRLTVLAIPRMTMTQRRTVARSIYADAVGALGPWFAREIDDDVLDRFGEETPRVVRKALDRALVRVGAAGRRKVVPEDVRVENTAGQGYGFLAGSG